MKSPFGRGDYVSSLEAVPRSSYRMAVGFGDDLKARYDSL